MAGDVKSFYVVLTCLACYRTREMVVTPVRGAETIPCECGGARWDVAFEVLDQREVV